MYVCLCKPVTDRQIRRAVAGGARSLRDLRQQLGIASTCGRCAVCALSCLRESIRDLEATACASEGCEAALEALPAPA